MGTRYDGISNILVVSEHYNVIGNNQYNYRYRD